MKKPDITFVFAASSINSMLIVKSKAMMKYPRFQIRVGIANAHRLNEGTQLNIVSLISHLPLFKGIFRGTYYIYIYIYIRSFRFLHKALVFHKVPLICMLMDLSICQQCPLGMCWEWRDWFHLHIESFGWILFLRKKNLDLQRYWF